MLLPSQDDLTALGNHRQDDPSKGLHVTLHYLGKAAESPVAKSEVVSALQALAPQLRPATALVTAVGALGNDEPKASVLFLQEQPLAPIHGAVKAQIPNIPESQYTKYRPHITMGYGTPLEPRRLGQKITIDRISLWWADEPAVTFLLGLNSYRVDL